MKMGSIEELKYELFYNFNVSSIIPCVFIRSFDSFGSDTERKDYLFLGGA